MTHGLHIELLLILCCKYHLDKMVGESGVGIHEDSVQ